MTAARILWQDPALRVTALVLALQGAVVCSWGPYVSDLAVRQYGYGDAGFALLLALSSASSVSAAVWVGVRADQTAQRRGLALMAAGALVLAMGLMTLVPGPLVLALVVVVLVPLAGTMFGQVFAQARLAASLWPEEQRDGIMALVRALFAAPFVVVLPLWAAAFAQGAPLAAIFPVSMLLAGVMLVLVWRGWPRDGGGGWSDRPSGLTLWAAVSEIGRPRTMGRVLALGAVNTSSTIYMVIVALVLVPAVGRGPGDVALYVGLVAGLEVPFMLLVPRLMRGVPRTRAILAGAALYGVHVALLPVLAGSAWLWLLVLPAAVGGAVTLTVPIAYMQDLMADRPGAGASLMAIQRLAGEVLAALCFGLGAALSGYGMAAVLGGAVSVAGGVALVLADRR